MKSTRSGNRKNGRQCIVCEWNVRRVRSSDGGRVWLVRREVRPLMTKNEVEVVVERKVEERKVM